MKRKKIKTIGWVEPTSILEVELDNIINNQKEMAHWYFKNILMKDEQAEVIEINEYIINRWSYSGLINIKRLAWKELESNKVMA